MDYDNDHLDNILFIISCLSSVHFMVHINSKPFMGSYDSSKIIQIFHLKFTLNLYVFIIFKNHLQNFKYIKNGLYF
jgi:hypothetical protein